MLKINFIVVAIFLLLSSCNNPSSSESKLHKINLLGQTMGTTFSIAYLDNTETDFGAEIEHLLVEINQAVSTYQPDSEISKFNQGDSITVDNDGHFARNYDLSKKIVEQSNGWFNPTVMPLVNYWGFGYKKQDFVKEVDTLILKNLLLLVQFDSINLEKIDNNYFFTKQKKDIELDFSAIAKGDAVDQVALLLESKGIENYFVEIGGEIRARGATIAGFPWRTAIQSPQNKSPEAQLIIELKNIALATSGNYQNYHEDKTTGQKYAHTINPKTGYPEQNNLLSVSVFAKDCATADAFATAFMAMGLGNAFLLAEELPDLEAYFIYSDNQGNLQEKYTSKASEFILKN